MVYVLPRMPFLTQTCATPCPAHCTAHCPFPAGSSSRAREVELGFKNTALLGEARPAGQAAGGGSAQQAPSLPSAVPQGGADDGVMEVKGEAEDAAQGPAHHATMQ